MQHFFDLIKIAADSYTKNFRLISFFSIPFLVAFPVALMLPNFAAMGAIFLRIGSIQGGGLSPTDIGLIVAAALLSMLLFSFALVAINMVIRSQRVIQKIAFYEFQKIEHYTYHLFELTLIGFLLVFGVNVVLYQYGLHATLGALFAALVSIALMFVAQAIVIDGLTGLGALKLSFSLIGRKLPHVVLFLVLSALLIAANDAAFIQLGTDPALFLFARFTAVVINAMVILPFLEVLKVQIYLSKYTLL
jgi:hypothetical protein